MSGCYCQPCDVYHEKSPSINDCSKLPRKMYKLYNEESNPSLEDDYPYTMQVRKLKTWCPHGTNVEYSDHRTCPRICEIPTNYSPHVDCKCTCRDSETKNTCSSLAQTSEEKCISTTTLAYSNFDDMSIIHNCFLRENKSCNTLTDYDDERKQVYGNERKKHKRSKEPGRRHYSNSEHGRHRSHHSSKEYKRRYIDDNEIGKSEPDDDDYDSDPYSVNSAETITSRSEGNYVAGGVTNFINDLFRPTLDETLVKPKTLKKKHCSLESSPSLHANYSTESHKADTKILWSGSKKYRKTDGRKRKKLRHASNSSPMGYQLLVLLLFFFGMYFFNSFIK